MGSTTNNSKEMKMGQLLGKLGEINYIEFMNCVSLSITFFKLRISFQLIYLRKKKKDINLNTTTILTSYDTY